MLRYVIFNIVIICLLFDYYYYLLIISFCLYLFFLLFFVYHQMHSEKVSGPGEVSFYRWFFFTHLAQLS